MKNTLKSIFGISAICLIAFASCKKKEDDSTKARLSGKWRLKTSVTDYNNNGSPDADETITIPDSATYNMTFNGDGNGDVTTNVFGSSITLGFTWTLTNSDQDIALTPGAPVGTFSLSASTFHIQSLSGSDMVLSDTTTVDTVVVKTWDTYKKQ
jgi:hypothetical protein